MDFDCNTIKYGAQQLVSGVVALFGGMVGGHVGGCVVAVGFGCVNEEGDPNLTAVKAFLVCAAVSACVTGKLCRDTLQRCGKSSSNDSQRKDQGTQTELPIPNFCFSRLQSNKRASAFTKFTENDDTHGGLLRTGSGA